MNKITFDLISRDERNDEFVVYLVEPGPWTDSLDDHLNKLQDRLYDAYDVVIDGYLASKYKESAGKKIRIEVDAHGSPPSEVLEFVRKFSRYIQTNPEKQKEIHESPFVQSLRIENGVDIGRAFD